MSQTRFIVTGAWRLGSSLAGLTDSPEWLRRAAISAIRHSVQHVLKAAETYNCQFILVAGAVASRENFSVAAAWLRDRSATLKRHGIRLVLLGHDENDLQQLQPLDVVAVPAHTCNWVLNGTLGAGPQFSGISGGLSFEFEGVSPVSGGVDARRIRITQLPHAGTAASLAAQQSSGGSLQVTAVSPQRLSADEHDRGCCQLVTADISRRSLEVQTIPTEVLEFHAWKNRLPPELLCHNCSANLPPEACSCLRTARYNCWTGVLVGRCDCLCGMTGHCVNVICCRSCASCSTRGTPAHGLIDCDFQMSFGWSCVQEVQL